MWKCARNELDPWIDECLDGIPRAGQSLVDQMHGALAKALDIEVDPGDFERPRQEPTASVLSHTSGTGLKQFPN